MSDYFTPSTPMRTPTVASIHPLVLLSVVDHYERVNRGAAVARRVVGLLVGTTTHPEAASPSSAAPNPTADGGGAASSAAACHVDAHNCFAVPFEEASADVWFLDTTYASEMHFMIRKVLPTASIVGWYSSGSRIDPCDTRIHHHIAERFGCMPLFCLINVDRTVRGVPVHAYVAIDPRHTGTDRPHTGAAAAASGDDGGGGDVTVGEFAHISCALTSTEAETIGVEQLLRDIDAPIASLPSAIGDRALSLAKLAEVLRAVEAYLGDVVRGRVEAPSHDVLQLVQQLLGMQPMVHQLSSGAAMIVSANDEALATFIAATSRTVMSLYDVVLNRKRVAAELEALRKRRREAAAAAAGGGGSATAAVAPPSS